MEGIPCSLELRARSLLPTSGHLKTIPTAGWVCILLIPHPLTSAAALLLGVLCPASVFPPHRGHQCKALTEFSTEVFFFLPLNHFVICLSLKIFLHGATVKFPGVCPTPRPSPGPRSCLCASWFVPGTGVSLSSQHPDPLCFARSTSAPSPTDISHPPTCHDQGQVLQLDRSYSFSFSLYHTLKSCLCLCI